MLSMKYSYYPGCTLRNKAKDLDEYARASAEHLGLNWKKSKTGSAAEAFILWELTKLLRSFLLYVLLIRPKKRARIW